MKNKKYLFLFLIIFILSIFYAYSKKEKKGTNLKFLSKKIFYQKNKNISSWVYEQIARDFNSIKEIKQNLLDTTFETIKSSGLIEARDFHRYRLINNKVFKACENDEELSSEILAIERALITLCKIIKLPNIDFIYCHLDALPLDNCNDDFLKKVYCPILCHAKNKNCNKLILIPDHISVSRNWKNLFDTVLKGNNTITWSQKMNKVFWRGGTNDQKYTEENFYKGPRIIISKLSQKYFNLIDAGITKSWFFQLEHLLRKEDLIKEYETIQKHLEYKYLPAIDGNMSVYPGYQWRLLSNSVCFKQKSDQIQWFALALQPYEHYIPVERDLSDLIEKIIWAQNNDEKCLEISKNARDFALNNLSCEAVYVYLYRVLKYYSKHQDFDRSFLLNDTIKNKKWICIQDKKKLLKTKIKQVKK